MADKEYDKSGSEKMRAIELDRDFREMIAKMQRPQNVAVGRSLFNMTNEELRRRLHQSDGEPMVPPKS